jgi:hypothetical protein
LEFILRWVVRYVGAENLHKPFRERHHDRLEVANFNIGRGYALNGSPLAQRRMNSGL